MTTFFWILGIIAGIIGGAAAGVYFSSKPTKSSFGGTASSFKKEQAKIMATLVEKKNDFEKELQDEKDQKQKEINEKIEEAKKLLRYSTKSLSAISTYLGFSSQSHFSRVFKKYVGENPSVYRNKLD